MLPMCINWWLGVYTICPHVLSCVQTNTNVSICQLLFPCFMYIVYSRSHRACARTVTHPCNQHTSNTYNSGGEPARTWTSSRQRNSERWEAGDRHVDLFYCIPSYVRFTEIPLSKVAKRVSRTAAAEERERAHRKERALVEGETRKQWRVWTQSTSTRLLHGKEGRDSTRQRHEG